MPIFLRHYGSMGSPRAGNLLGGVLLLFFFLSAALGSSEVWPEHTSSCTKLISHPGGEQTQSSAAWL